eukprot:TRINITY_DN5553_c0_g1_i1.p1 TRINITY_DN5553_c0_g1~~TRINITY_DN5553_c0_g1_i1.p1  ORF type:complete len:632 (-),score=124.76 TRINITY_DN5553_c0_g1_i1:295-2190(-)
MAGRPHTIASLDSHAPFGDSSLSRRADLRSSRPAPVSQLRPSSVLPANSSGSSKTASAIQSGTLTPGQSEHLISSFRSTEQKSPQQSEHQYASADAKKVFHQLSAAHSAKGLQSTLDAASDGTTLQQATLASSYSSSASVSTNLSPTPEAYIPHQNAPAQSSNALSSVANEKNRYSFETSNSMTSLRSDSELSVENSAPVQDNYMYRGRVARTYTGAVSLSRDSLSTNAHSSVQERGRLANHSFLDRMKRFFSVASPANQPRSSRATNPYTNAPATVSALDDISGHLSTNDLFVLNWDAEKQVLMRELNRNMEEQAATLGENDRLKKEVEELKSIVELNQKNWQKLFQTQASELEKRAELNVTLEQRVAIIASENDRLVAEVDAMKVTVNQLLGSESRLLDENQALQEQVDDLLDQNRVLLQEIKQTEDMHISAMQDLQEDKAELLTTMTNLISQQAESKEHSKVIDLLRLGRLPASYILDLISKNRSYTYLLHSARSMKQKMALLDEAVISYQTKCDWDLLVYILVFLKGTLQYNTFLQCFRDRPGIVSCYIAHLKSKGDMDELMRFYTDLENYQGQYEVMLQRMFEASGYELRIEMLENLMLFCASHKELEPHLALLLEYKQWYELVDI